jgi:Uncharacterized protein conserved in bacteria
MPKDKIKIVFTQIFYPLTMGSYFLAALEARDDVELYTVGPFSGTWIPWLGGMNLPQRYVKVPDFPMNIDLAQRSADPTILESKLPWKPDLWFGVDAGFYWNRKPKDGKVIYIGTDPHVLNYADRRTKCDIFYNMQKCYLAPGDTYLPYAYSKKWHYPVQHDEYEFDVCCIGAPYQHRNEQIQRLRSKGLRVYYEVGPVFNEYREIFTRSKIGLNWSTMNDLNARHFELPAMKVPMVASWVPDANLFFKTGDDYFAFKSLDDSLFNIDYLLNHDKERLEMAEHAYQTVTEAKHSYEDRVEMVLKDTGLL